MGVAAIGDGRADALSVGGIDFRDGHPLEHLPVTIFESTAGIKASANEAAVVVEHEC